MTEKTTAELEAEAEAFVDSVRASMPDSLRGRDVIQLCGLLITGYLGPEEAQGCLEALVRALADYYEAQGQWHCPRCTAERKNNAH